MNNILRKAAPSLYQKCIKFTRLSSLCSFSTIPPFATIDPYAITEKAPGVLQNLTNGEWFDGAKSRKVVDPLNGDFFLLSPDTQVKELDMFVASMKKVSKSGTHNIYKKPERFLMYGEVNAKVAEALRNPDIFNFFTKCIQRVMPKSDVQAAGELNILRKFFENFSGDNVRVLMRGFVQAGDCNGQRSIGYRWPYGPVAVISPFNFPLEIPIMQLVSAAMVGNKPILKPESRVGLPVEQFIRLLHYCGLPKDEVDLIHCSGSVMDKLLRSANFRMTQFTGGTKTAEAIIEAVNGKVKLEDAGLDWKVLGPMPVNSKDTVKLLEYIAWQCDQDAYSLSGQKCSAQSVALIHEDWIKSGLIEQLRNLASRRKLTDMTLSPVFSHTNRDIEEHLRNVLRIPGSEVLFGGKPLTNHQIPSQFGSFEPTAVLVDLEEALKTSENYEIVTTELFGPLQIIIRWSNKQEALVLEFLDKMEALLSAAVVSHDPVFLNRLLANTSNGTTYCGIKARTTGAPQNHWFGPSGTPLAAGIGTPEAILSTWTCHREIVYDEGPIPCGWAIPPPS